MTLQDVCKAKAQALSVTYPQISDKTGIPLQTVRNFFSSSSKAPSINTAGPICEFLGVSLDEYYGITDHMTPTEETLSARNDTLKAHREELEQRVASNDKTIDILVRGIRMRNHIIAALLVLLCLVAMYALYLDLHCVQLGFWRG